MATITITIEQLRAYWAKQQGLLEPISGGVADVLRASGWITSAGSTLPYLAIRARLPHCGRAEVERTVYQEESVLEIQAMRGCMMLVPAEDASLVLWSARQTDRASKVRTSCRITEREESNLAARVIELLEGGPLTADEMRDRLPKRLVRSLGTAGKQFGESSTLTFVLRQLQKQGVLRRFATNHRLDSNQFSYKLSNPVPTEPESAEYALREHARRFFQWAGPSTVKEFAWWAGITQKEAKAAIASLGLKSISAPDWSLEAWIHEDRLDDLTSSKKPAESSAFHFLPFRDNYLYFRRGIGVFLQPADLQQKVPDWKNRPVPIGELESLHHNAIVLQGRLIGSWEYDPEAEKIVWSTHTSLAAGQRRALTSQIEELEDHIRKELGDVQFYAFDTGRIRRERVDSLR